MREPMTPDDALLRGIIRLCDAERDQRSRQSRIRPVTFAGKRKRACCPYDIYHVARASITKQTFVSKPVLTKSIL